MIIIITINIIRYWICMGLDVCILDFVDGRCIVAFVLLFLSHNQSIRNYVAWWCNRYGSSAVYLFSKKIKWMVCWRYLKYLKLLISCFIRKLQVLASILHYQFSFLYWLSVRKYLGDIQGHNQITFNLGGLEFFSHAFSISRWCKLPGYAPGEIFTALFNILVIEPKRNKIFLDSSLYVMRIATKKNEENFPYNPELSIIFTSLQFSWYSMGRERYFFLNPIKKMTRKS